jgi:hypothetical protein
VEVKVRDYISSAEQSDVTVILRPSGLKANAEVQQVKSSAHTEVNLEWRISDVQLPPPSIIDKPPIHTRALHPSISDFAQTLAGIDGIRCIVVEDTEGQIIHFTSFASPMADELRKRVYAAEASLIDRYPSQIFDFHLRSADDTVGGSPVPTPGEHFFVIWGNLDEDSGRASETGEKQ